MPLLPYNSGQAELSVLVFDGKSAYTPSVLRCLAENQKIRIGILSNTALIPSRVSRYCSYFGTIQDSDAVETLERVAVQEHFDVVLPADEKAVKLLSQNHDRLSQKVFLHPVPAPQAVSICMDKWLTAEFLHRHNIPAPATALYSSHDSAANIAEVDREGPVLVKPRRGSNGEEIEYFPNLSDALRFLSLKQSRRGQYIIQDYVKGHDIDCSVLCLQGEVIAFTVQQTRIAGARRFGPPAGIDFVDNPAPLEVVRPVVRTLNWHGSAHIDLRYDSQARDYKVLELNPRYWGSLLGSLAAGVNFPLLACHAAQGITPPPVRQRCAIYLSMGGMAR